MAAILRSRLIQVCAAMLCIYLVYVLFLWMESSDISTFLLRQKCHRQLELLYQELVDYSFLNGEVPLTQEGEVDIAKIRSARSDYSIGRCPSTFATDSYVLLHRLSTKDLNANWRDAKVIAMDDVGQHRENDSLIAPYQILFSDGITVTHVMDEASARRWIGRLRQGDHIGRGGDPGNIDKADIIEDDKKR